MIKEKEKDDQTELEEDETAFMKRENHYMFSFKQRREHYKRKITSLDQQIKELNDERISIENIRARYTIKMRSHEKKVLEIKLEVEKLSHYSADTITSTVLSGFNMQYKTIDFRKRIDVIYKKKLKIFSKISSLLTTVKTDMMLYELYFEKFREYSLEVKELKSSIVDLFMKLIMR